jgi:mRNA interferase HigB
MHVLTGKYLKEAADRYRDAARQIVAWRAIARDKRWRNPDEVRETFADVECVGDYVIFPIHQNRYRLVATIHYSRDSQGKLAEGHVWIRSFLSKKQYENAANWEKGVPR